MTQTAAVAEVPQEIRARLALALDVAPLPRLRLRGFMTIARETSDPTLQRQQFRQLAALMSAAHGQGLTLDTLSMGMSADLESAIAEGATLVRVGSAIFGPRGRRLDARADTASES